VLLGLACACSVMLARMISAFVRDGRTVFQQRNFINDESIIVDPLHANITVRIQRLEQRLLERIPEIRISKVNRGNIIGSLMQYRL